MRTCSCGLGGDGHATVREGRLTCPYCSGEIVCQTPPKLCSSAQAYEAVGPAMRRQKFESMWVFLLNARNAVIGKREICRGTANMCVVHPCDVFGAAIARSAIAIILVHNHPSGDSTPSPEDVQLTKRLVDAGKLMGIPVLDHLVIGIDGYSSLRDMGMIS